MEKSIFSPLYEAFQARLLVWRKAAGLTQRQLAARLRRERSFVARIEQGERRVDFVEAYWIAKACRLNPEKAIAEAARAVKAADRRRP